MKKLKTLFTITLVIDILATIPLFLVMFIPSMKEEMIYSQFPGMAENEIAKELSDLFHFVFTFIAVSMVIAVAVSIKNICFGGSQNGSVAIVYHSLGLGTS